MTPLHAQVMMPSGEMFSAHEILSAFVRLAESQATFPLLSHDDKVKACVNLAFEAVQVAEEDSE